MLARGERPDLVTWFLNKGLPLLMWGNTSTVRNMVNSLTGEFQNYVTVEMMAYLRVQGPRQGGKHKFDTMPIVVAAPESSITGKV